MPQTIIDHLRSDHDKVRELLARIDDTGPGQRGDLFNEVVTELARHEAAERALVHPRTREAPQGDKVADSVIAEEQEAEELLARMEDMDATSDEFLDAFRKLRTAVENHASHEEDTEFPRLQETYSQEELEELAEKFERLEELGPTHPHPNAPNDGVSQKVLGPVAGAFDRARDAVSKALSS